MCGILCAASFGLTESIRVLLVGLATVTIVKIFTEGFLEQSLRKAI
jgi:hypothetical protein